MCSLLLVAQRQLALKRTLAEREADQEARRRQAYTLGGREEPMKMYPFSRSWTSQFAKPARNLSFVSAAVWITPGS